MREISTLNVYNKLDICKDLKQNEKQEIDVLKIIKENCKNVTEEELKQIEEKLSFDYKYEKAIEIPTKTSVTVIAHKDFNTFVDDDDAKEKFNTFCHETSKKYNENIYHIDIRVFGDCIQI